MAYLSKKEFAAKCGIATNYLSVMIGRGKVLMSGDFVDTDVAENALYLEKKMAKLEIKVEAQEVEVSSAPLNSPSIAPVERKAKRLGLEPKPLSAAARELKRIDRETKLAALHKIELANKKLEAEIQVITGKSIPVSVVKEIISRLGMSFITKYKEGADRFLIEISHKKKLNRKDSIDLKEKLTNIINDSHQKSISTAKISLKKIIAEVGKGKGG